MNILFWNINKTYIPKHINRIIETENIDIVILAENPIPPDTLLTTLNFNRASFYYAQSSGCRKLDVFTKFNHSYIKPISEYDRLSIRLVSIPGTNPFLLAMVHMPDKRNWTDDDQMFECVRLADSIIKAEKELKNTYTMLVGDFNMDPFEKGIVSSKGLHAIMCKKIASEKSRIVQGEEYPFFYNPMWNFMGDETEGPVGTYYYRSAKHINYFWHTFDQVLLRPSFFNGSKLPHVKIIQLDLKEIKCEETGNKQPDHYPIAVNLPL